VSRKQTVFLMVKIIIIMVTIKYEILLSVEIDKISCVAWLAECPSYEVSVAGTDMWRTYRNCGLTMDRIIGNPLASGLRTPNDLGQACATIVHTAAQAGGQGPVGEGRGAPTPVPPSIVFAPALMRGTCDVIGLILAGST